MILEPLIEPKLTKPLPRPEIIRWPAILLSYEERMRLPSAARHANLLHRASQWCGHLPVEGPSPPIDIQFADKSLSGKNSETWARVYFTKVKDHRTTGEIHQFGTCNFFLGWWPPDGEPSVSCEERNGKEVIGIFDYFASRFFECEVIPDVPPE